MLIELLRFVRGTLEFRVEGKYLERFLNLSARARIPIWDGQREEHSFCGKTLQSNEEALKRIAEKVQLQWHSNQLSGAPKLRRKYQKRLGIGAGALFLCALLLLSQQFVWRLEVKGNQTVSAADVIEVVEKQGLKPGVWKGSLDVIKLADTITLRLEEVSWAAVNLLGTVAEIEIVERVEPPFLIDEETPCNVVSTKAGRIVELEVYDGQRLVKVGDTIKEGGLISAGILQDRHGRTIYRHARAKAVVEYTKDEHIEIPMESKELLPLGGVENTYSLLLGGTEIPLSLEAFSRSGEFSTENGLVESGVYQSGDKQYFYSVRNKPIRLFAVELPLKIRVKQYIPAVPIELNCDAQRAKDLALLKLSELKRHLERQDIMVIDEELKGRVQGKKFILNAKLLCREDTAKEIPIQMETKDTEN